MNINAENLTKAWILGLNPSILVRISKENSFFKCFFSLKLILSRPLFLLAQNGCCSPFLCLGFRAPAGQDRVQWKSLFATTSRLGLLVSSFDLKVHCCSEIFSHYSEIKLRCSEHSLPLLICLHPFWGF